ncbi:hypothetical protein FN846DRAFT_910880 [Sphaerosporella brunnea]|uniref:Uncharacterized protein n=1 Tax=Sphaerosporella brunnea TaxID=1250544 RepID=A0A5J5EKR5_9PEZI|nr:hypothetical protein FN846DRAFT_910880 [Sphaerosporella brunnea]
MRYFRNAQRLITSKLFWDIVLLGLALLAVGKMMLRDRQDLRIADHGLEVVGYSHEAINRMIARHQAKKAKDSSEVGEGTSQTFPGPMSMSIDSAPEKVNTGHQ